MCWWERRTYGKGQIVRKCDMIKENQCSKVIITKRGKIVGEEEMGEERKRKREKRKIMIARNRERE